MYIIIGNFGNHSLAAMQALIEKNLSDVHFLYVETGWADSSWSQRIAACSDYATAQGVRVHRLKSQATFAQMVIERKQFPSRKFQWCASFLKGLPIISHLDDYDPSCEAYIVSGKRRSDSRRYADLQEFEYENELYQGRTLWNPLWQTLEADFIQLITRTGFSPLLHPSLECSPCIHLEPKESPIESAAMERLEKLEQVVGQTMFQMPIKKVCALTEIQQEQPNFDLQHFDFGCGSPWGCGE
ncbi:phosphoadenosine phosphosulfate reductase domain-containing protein [Legionella hackeliae]|uniref:Phosphoadenosine phosphosulphate reductase domain-containing protein n=1 Tax=Legionella hackeliae TaxID=449 RepID=A0A0A8ULR8_LEGHA|nr:phosphoadenosine phosphosulfate reductase family protein [Legionella hackeliae]KTD10321.1 Phosphoadenosine phosphosulfate reductase family protein [Legionella hackeliae]CEK09820.1 protein of unknown function [Legionella hackeliae]STX49729.1 Phosphoadenosine phosphosulfate reductase family [Legionella hackeliae]